MFAEVLVEIAHENVSKLFTYRVPEGMEIQPGTRVLVPFGPRKIEGYALRLADTPPEGVKPRDILRPLEKYPALLPQLVDLAMWLTETTHCLPVEAIRLMLPAEMRGERVRVREVEMARLAIDGDTLEAEKLAVKKAPRALALLNALSEGDQPAAEMRKIGGDWVKKLAEKGVIALYGEESLRSPQGSDYEATPDPELTDDQCRALDQLLPALTDRKGRFLLSGVTGSGKTEVYIRAVREALKQGRAAIVLVPEIALTPQMVGWFRARFGDQSAVLHSRLSAGERFDEWRRIRRGEARVVVGARSAVFAPTENLGLIIVDEEHETTYLSDRHPRYDAREVAQRRCDTEGATLILASATPSLKSFARTVPTMKNSLGPLTLLEMPRRVLNRPMPDIEVVDMREELVRGNRSVFSRALHTALKGCIARGEQAMLFINRRGHATFVSCRACGESLKCPNCDVSLTDHRFEGVLQCHYCGYTEKMPEACPKCGAPSLKCFGAGTQKVEEAVREQFPGVPTLRMDLDTTQGKDAHAKLLDRFRRGDAKILIGTQMIAKGLDFPSVTLVGVVAADATLNLPDYRSAERAFSLIVQVAGRAGRAEKRGKVIVQTYDPAHYAIEAASRQDFRAFFENEFDRRRRGLYPPFTRMARLLIEADTPARAQEIAEGLEKQMQAFLYENPALNRQIVQMRAMEAPVKLIRGRARWQLFAKLYTRGPTDDILQAMDALSAREYGGAQVFLEIDPATML